MAFLLFCKIEIKFKWEKNFLRKKPTEDLWEILGILHPC